MGESAVRVLLVEDDEKLSRQIERFLRKYDYDVTIEHSGTKAIALILDMQPDVVVLDLMLPDADGFDVCRRARSQFTGSILMLTASEDDMDQVAGIEMGADGYLIKPIHPRVLLAHIRMLLRRRLNAGSPAPEAPASEARLLQFGDLMINPVQRIATLASQDVTLTPSEFDVLHLLASHPEKIVSRNDILRALRNIEYDGLDRSVDVKVSALRKKLGDSTVQPRRIITVRAKGYLFVPDAW